MSAPFDASPTVLHGTTTAELRAAATSPSQEAHTLAVSAREALARYLALPPARQATHTQVDALRRVLEVHATALAAVGFDLADEEQRRRKADEAEALTRDGSRCRWCSTTVSWTGEAPKGMFHRHRDSALYVCCEDCGHGIVKYSQPRRIGASA